MIKLLLLFLCYLFFSGCAGYPKALTFNEIVIPTPEYTSEEGRV